MRLFLPDPESPVVPRQGGEFVLYFLQATLRTEDNFALNFAIERANELRLPVLVYHGLRRDYPWANDRLHTFVLESALDLQKSFAQRGIPYVFYLDQDRGPRAPSKKHGASPLVALANRAALVVTDFVPAFIARRQIHSLRQRTTTPVIAVDSATVVPLRYHKVEYQSARGIRGVLQDALPTYLVPIPTVEPIVRRSIEIPFEQVHLSSETIPQLVASCEIDHQVPPSRTLRGGSGAAQKRLEHFLKHGLFGYAERRSDPNDDATSRLSSYLHFGNLSMHQVLLSARKASGQVDYDKFLDEALTWRELAHNFVFFNKNYRTLGALPEWARNELWAHKSDPRPILYSQEQLEAACTEDGLWNACQRALREEGELHNYLRMLWGKAVLLWTPSPEAALLCLEHLNNKYALDGRDANSYGGIQWIFGKFDRPFYRRPIFGTVRYQSLKTQSKKFDVAQYLRRYPEPKGCTPAYPM